MKQPPRADCGQDFDEAVCPVRHKTQVGFLNIGRRVEFPECVSCPHLVTILVDKPIDKKPETPENIDEPKETEKMKQPLKCKKCGDSISQRIAAGSGTCKKCRQKQYQAAYLAKKNNDPEAPAQAKPTAGGQYVTGSAGCSRCGTTTPVDLLENSSGGPICPTCAGKFDKPAPKTGAKKSICHETAPKVTQEKSNVTFEPAANTIHASPAPQKTEPETSWQAKSIAELPISLKELQRIAHENAVAKGWHETRRSDGEMICLMHSELSEALEELRNGKTPAEIYFKDQKPEGVPIELADVVIRVFDFCGLHNIDLQAAIVTKMVYNQTRPHRHGGKKL